MVSCIYLGHILSKGYSLSEIAIFNIWYYFLCFHSWLLTLYVEGNPRIYRLGGLIIGLYQLEDATEFNTIEIK
ncbi:MAG: hypothetical protein IH840_09960 [Candidatus Heimdallarchaeota archaeon]|nr:hypothetical protein [Candidatus Heimdallarchaeota archaeon]